MSLRDGSVTVLCQSLILFSDIESQRDPHQNQSHIEKGKVLGLKGQPVTQTLAQFYTEYKNDPSARERYYEAQIEGRGQTRSSFFRVTVGAEEVSVEIYRDDAHGGPYELRKTFILN